MRRCGEDTAAGFLARLLLIDENLKAFTPGTFRNSARMLDYDDKVLICIDIAEVEYDAWCKWKNKEQALHEKIADKFHQVSSNGKVF